MVLKNTKNQEITHFCRKKKKNEYLVEKMNISLH